MILFLSFHSFFNQSSITKFQAGKCRPIVVRNYTFTKTTMLSILYEQKQAEKKEKVSERK